MKLLDCPHCKTTEHIERDLNFVVLFSCTNCYDGDRANILGFGLSDAKAIESWNDGVEMELEEMEAEAEWAAQNAEVA